MTGKRKNTRIPKQKRAVETRNHIIQVAKLLFSRKGLHGTNSREIAAEAGISVGAFYSYFADKKVLLLEVLKLHLEQFLVKAFLQEKMGVFDGLEKKEIIYNVITRIIGAYDHSPEFHRETLVLRYSDPDVKRLYDEAKALELNYTLSILKLFQEDLRIENLEAAAFVVHGAIEKAAHSIQLLGPDIDQELVLDELSDMISAYLFKSS
ncbi:MAG: TetR/AcrR family transcriptional regulator [Deltaproteobacteria bacterium]|nr:TetR/AcrR family transcriptional regulator [Deltaproteobacteria bacterium]